MLLEETLLARGMTCFACHTEPLLLRAARGEAVERPPCWCACWIACQR